MGPKWKKSIRIRLTEKKILDKLKANGFIKMGQVKTRQDIRSKTHVRKQTLRGTSRGDLVNLEKEEIIGYYNSVLGALFNSYGTKASGLGRIF